MKRGRNDSQLKKHALLPGSLLEVGRVVRPHGVSGHVVISSDAAYFGDLTAGTQLILQPGDLELSVLSNRLHQGRFLVLFEGYTDRDQAETLRSHKVFLSAADLPELEEGEYFFWQLTGLRVRIHEGKMLGTIRTILETGANDVYVVQNEEGQEVLIPAIKDVVQNIDLEQGIITITPLPGLLPDDQED